MPDASISSTSRRRLGEVDRQRLLAEDRDAAGEAGANEGRVGARARGDDQRIGAGDRLVDAGRRGPDLGRDRDRALGVGIGQDEGAGLEQVGEDRCVHRADASRAELRDAHQATASRTATRRAYSSTRRPIAAASDGRSLDESCSTISHPS